ncbi:unnamed protein product [Gongylonema pulchrum]|uniref:WAP domain-containing protein n=1 Tax=Gongylonema pulchrum TaxID=637853 RepID=A0A183DQ52_9BILA|nr:unnamed protein product [Gongylonema pulchrum]
MLLRPVIVILHHLSLPAVLLPQTTYLPHPIIGITAAHSCPQRPPGCELHCPFGYRFALTGTCLCSCQDDPCFVRLISCPRLVGGACVQRCSGDAECGGLLKCCSNGCGRECVMALAPLALLDSLSIHPLQATGRINRVGNCPPKNYIKKSSCILECTHDEECPWVEKCCDNGCGRVCTPPDKATACTVDGRFKNIQCDKSYCWCVDEKGSEVTGTKAFKEAGLPNCLRRKSCSGRLCAKLCQFGTKTDDDGCPLETCECRNICDSVKCTNDFDRCQLVEPECARPPCQPIGFNNLGFCCPRPESEIHKGTCLPNFSRPNGHCVSECHVDSDCSTNAKCCFDGCSLKCMPVAAIRADHSTERSIVVPEQLTTNEKKTPYPAECPSSIPPNVRFGKCGSQCKTDQDCPGVKKCCKYGCTSLCLFPTKATEIYGRARAPKCDERGNFEQIQCENGACYCVDTVNGSEIPATRVAFYKEPVCHGVPDICSRYESLDAVTTSVLCESESDCPDEYWCNSVGIQSKGLCCPLLKGQLPDRRRCATTELYIEPSEACEIQCKTGVSTDEPRTAEDVLVQKDHCPPIKQHGITCPSKKEVCVARLVDECTDGPCVGVPDCIINACPHGLPIFDEATFEPIRCSSNTQCTSVDTPSFCHKFRMLDGYCCGGTEMPASSLRKTTKLGECPSIDQSKANCVKEEDDECAEDSDCGTVQKCCSNGCRKLCTYAEVTTGWPIILVC